ncbi:MAG: TolC family protein [Burkholderiales bacterium]|nr:TolC family protein [Burkholderiales bacterium]
MTTHTALRRRARPAVAALALIGLVSLGGCATFSRDGGFGPVAQTAQDRLHKDLTWARSDADRHAIDERVAELLAQPLSVEDSVQIALLNNRGLQASFDQLGISEADVVQAGRLPNPGFRFGRLSQGASIEIDRSIQFNLARLLTLPLAQRIESQRFEQTRLAVSLAMLQLASQTRKAYYLLLAADQSAGYMRQVQATAQAGAELARRMAQAGNWNRLDQAREQRFYADAALSLARAEQARVAAREQLTRLMGLWGAQTQFRLPERLPDLPKAPSELPEIERTALAQRIDVQAARLATEQLARNLGLTRATRFVNVLEVGAVRKSFSDAPDQSGYEIGLELPLFDWGDARVAKAEAIYMQAVNRTAQIAVDARSEVRGAYANYRASFDIARHFRDEIVPLSKTISDENQLRYNGMLIGVFELLADARAQIGSVNGYIDALRDFWLAQADLDMVQLGSPGAIAMPAAAASALDRTAAGN